MRISRPTSPTVFAALAACAIISWARAEDLPPVDATVFYSKDDAHWKDAEKILDAVTRELPRVKLEKISIDDPKGYTRLTEVEQSHKVIEPGELTLEFGPFVLISKGERRDVEKYFGPLVRRILDPKAGKGRLKGDAAAYAGAIFGKDARVEEAPKVAGGDAALDAVWYRVLNGEKNIGWVVDAYWPIACPVCNDTQFMVALQLPDAKVLDVRPVREIERMGLALEPKEGTAFTAQFKNMAPPAPPKIDGISGATKTASSYQSALARILDEAKKRETK